MDDKMDFGIFPYNMNSMARAVKKRSSGAIKFDVSEISLDKLTKYAITLGYNLFELNVGVEYMYPGTCDKYVIKELKILKEENKLRYTVHLPFLGLDLTSINNHSRKAAVNCQVEMINLTKSLEPENYVLHSSGGIAPLFLNAGKRFGIKNHSLNELTEAAKSSVAEILDKTKIPSKSIAIENINYPFESTLEVIEENNCSFCVDTGHFLAGYSGKCELLEIIKEYLPNIAEIHLHDCYIGENSNKPIDHQALGTGLLDPIFIELLQNIPFSKPIMLEMTLEQVKKSEIWLEKNYPSIKIK
ncbi:MAG: sugar phosphate isomerase/epimerase [Promethearchaeota archaeon]|nr:MAG: sugar phosphate isomerase/epimerase [Candidatus Lokiarchaeota archaeon]